MFNPIREKRKMNQRESIDAVRMVREIRDRHYEQTKDMTAEERVEFYREKARRLHKSLDGQQEESFS